MNHLMALDSTASAQGSGLSMIAMLLVYGSLYCGPVFYLLPSPEQKEEERGRNAEERPGRVMRSPRLAVSAAELWLLRTKRILS